MKTYPLGLDIGSSTMKAVLFSGDEKSIALSVAMTVPTPPKGMVSEAPLDEEEMARAIAHLVAESKSNATTVNIALPENKVYTKVLDMPVLSDKELSSAIYWEAEQYIPVPLDTITLDWKVLKRPEKTDPANKMQVLLVAAPTQLIEKYQKILSLSGLTITYIETEILSAIRALMFPYTQKKDALFPNTIVVNIGAMTTSVAIIKGGIIVFTYSVAIGGAALNRAIAADFGFSLQQAEEYKKTYGISQQELGGKISESAKPILLSIVGEVKKAIAFYNDKYKNDALIQQVLLTGGSAKLPGIDSFFAQNIEIETATANPWNVLSNQQVPREIIDNAADYTIAIGLALRAYE
ncbi:MAG: type IV pilus assembly protein PilM [Candidatus Levybacteria bacterium]|nr:type IV pilus assembly protein PilM [Candidatus Levybacteria bacterium]